MARLSRPAIAAISLPLAAAVVVAGLAYWLTNEQGDGEIESALVSIRGDDIWLNVTCEVVSTPEERAHGLMDRETLAQDRGMLFVFDPPQEVSFWMKDTLIPLDIIFVNASGGVVRVWEADVEPGVPDAELTRYPSGSPAAWVVEVNQGLCASAGIGEGSQVTITMLD